MILRSIQDETCDRLYERNSERQVCNFVRAMKEYVPEREEPATVVNAVVPNVIEVPAARAYWKRKPWVRSRWSRESVQRR